MRLEGKTAIVTGGSRGIGRAIVETLAGEGAKVAFAYHSNADAANALVEELKSKGHEALAVQANVADKSAADAVVEKVVGEWGKLDILVNNAGIVRDTLLARMTVEQWQEVIDTNLTGVFNFCQAAIGSMMSARSGRIVNMSSVASHYSNPGQSNYAASKGGIEGFTRCLATEYAKRGITVNAVAPGFIETEMTEAVRNAAEDQIKKHIPMRRLGQPADIAKAVLFLVSEESTYVTGQVLTVDGGLTLGGL